MLRAMAWRGHVLWLKKKPRGIYRVLHSAAAIRRRRIVVGEKRKQYHKAYDYLRKRIRFLDYCEYRRNHLPIGSGVTEAACETVFTQRLKQSGTTWSLEGGQWIVDLRVVHLSGIWPQVYQGYLQANYLPETGTQQGLRRKAQKSRKIPGTGAITPSASRVAHRLPGWFISRNSDESDLARRSLRALGREEGKVNLLDDVENCLGLEGRTVQSLLNLGGEVSIEGLGLQPLDGFAVLVANAHRRDLLDKC